MRLETARLVLRPYAAGDAAAMAPIFADPHVRRFYPSVLTPAETAAMIDRAMALAAADGFHFGVAELKGSGRPVGHVGLGRIPDLTREAIPSHPEVEVGWVFDKHVWGQGLAPEAAGAWLSYAWEVLDLPEVVAFTAAINRPSQRVMQKLGMHRDEADDFAHPRIPAEHPLHRHVLYRIANPRWVSST